MVLGQAISVHTSAFTYTIASVVSHLAVVVQYMGLRILVRGLVGIESAEYCTVLYYFLPPLDVARFLARWAPLTSRNLVVHKTRDPRTDTMHQEATDSVDFYLLHRVGRKMAGYF